MIVASPTSAVRRGLYDGLIIGVFLAALEILDTAVLKNPYVMVDSQFADSVERIVALCIAAALAVVYVAIGARGRRGEPTQSAGLQAGVVAGSAAAVVLGVTAVVADNLLFEVLVAHHHAVDTPGGAPITHYSVTTMQLSGSVPLVLLAAGIGGVLGHIGGRLVDRRHGTTT
jgi:hypothetical protein